MLKDKTHRPGLSFLLRVSLYLSQAGEASVDSWFRETQVPRARCVYLAAGFDFHEKKIVLVLGRSGPQGCHQPPASPLYYKGQVKKTIFTEILCTCTTGGPSSIYE